MRTLDISNDEDILDSRDIDARIAELEEMQDDDDWKGSEEKEELENLCRLRDDLEGYCSDWKYGVTLIRDSYFREYAEELVKDIGDLPKDLPWYIESNIDWKGVADDVRQDYTSGDFDGVTYWAR